MDIVFVTLEWADTSPRDKKKSQERRKKIHTLQFTGIKNVPSLEAAVNTTRHSPK